MNAWRAASCSFFHNKKVHAVSCLSQKKNATSASRFAIRYYLPLATLPHTLPRRWGARTRFLSSAHFYTATFSSTFDYTGSDSYPFEIFRSLIKTWPRSSSSPAWVSSKVFSHTHTYTFTHARASYSWKKLHTNVQFA